MSCVLCLEVTESYKDLIVFNSSEWQELNMKYIIEKYLWKLEVLNSQSYICQACWQELYNFHKFYLKLEKARSNLNDLLNTEEVTKKAVETGNEEPKLEILIFKEDYSVDIFEKEYEDEASYLKTNSKRKCSEKKSSHDKKNGKNSSRKRSNKEQNNIEVNELKSNENTDEIDIKLEVERIENDKPDEDENKIDIQLKIIENEMENAEESICLKRSTKRKCPRKKGRNDNKIIARESSRKRSSKDKNKIENKIKKLKSDKSPDEIDKKLEVEKIEKDVKENSMQFDENVNELKTKLELEIIENDAKQNKMEEDDQNDSSTKDDDTSDDTSSHDTSSDDTSSDESESDPLNKLSDEDKFIAENFQISCDICQIPQDTYSAAMKHFKDIHNQRGYIKCCGNKFGSRVELVDHLHVHKNPEYLKCKYCNKTFSKRASVKKHIKYAHEENRVECDICGKSLATEPGLRRHKLIHNTEDKMVSCKQCGKSYLSKYSLRNHIHVAHLTNIICHLCGKSIIIYDFKRHMAEHEGKPLPKVSCKMCDRQFSDKRCLNRHVRSHHPPEGTITEFKCAQCQKLFTADYNLKSHIRRVHDNAFVSKCTLCDKTFKKNKSLKEHMSRHRGEPLYNCDFCSRKFFSNGNYNTHRKICSGNRKKNM